MYGQHVECIQCFGGGALRERGHLEDLGLDGRIKVNVYLSSLMIKVPDHVYVLG
jgi:hypothetical protein